MAKKKDKAEESGAEPSRIELITPPAPNQAHIGRIGFGLVLSFPLGWGPLSDAFAGRGAYEVSMAKFLLVVAACTFGTTLIGKLLDAAPPEAPISLGLGEDDDDTESAMTDLENAVAKAGRKPSDSGTTGLSGRNDSTEHQSAPIRS